MEITFISTFTEHHCLNAYSSVVAFHIVALCHTRNDNNFEIAVAADGVKTHIPLSFNKQTSLLQCHREILFNI